MKQFFSISFPFILLGITLIAVSLALFRVNQKIENLELAEDLPTFTVASANAIQAVSKGELEILQAAHLLYSIHSKELESCQLLLEKALEEKEIAVTSESVLRAEFLQYKDTLGNTDLFKTNTLQLQVVTSVPPSWTTPPNTSAVLAVGPSQKTWLNKWVYLENYGIYFCSSISKEEGLFLLGEKEETVSCEVVLLGDQILVSSSNELKQFQDRWNQ